LRAGLALFGLAGFPRLTRLLGERFPFLGAFMHSCTELLLRGEVIANSTVENTVDLDLTALKRSACWSTEIVFPVRFLI